MVYRISSFVLLCCLFFHAYTVKGGDAHTPYVAKLESTVFLAKPGEPESLWEKQAMTQARDRQGRIYMSTDSPSAGSLVTLRDVVAGKTYRIDHKSKKVILIDMQDFGGTRSPATEEQKADTGRRTVTINGIPCVKTDVLASVNGTPQKAGESCRSYELDLELRSEIRIDAGGRQRHVLTELTELQTGTAPPSEWFKIPAEYAFEDRSK